jgi:predicted PurR-regulated permease PerM
MLVGRRFGISTLVVVLAVMFWGWVWGPLGMLLAVPLTMLIKVMLDSSEEFRWIAVAISAEQPQGSVEKKLLEVTPTLPVVAEETRPLEAPGN